MYIDVQPQFYSNNEPAKRLSSIRVIWSHLQLRQTVESSIPNERRIISACILHIVNSREPIDASR